MSQFLDSDEVGDVSTRVLEAVAEANGTSPIELSPPLYEVIDPDALNALFRSGRRSESDLEVTFEYQGLEVTVADDGCIGVDKRRNQAAVEADENEKGAFRTFD